jgi:hypothetical protein
MSTYKSMEDRRRWALRWASYYADTNPWRALGHSLVHQVLALECQYTDMVRVIPFTGPESIIY